MLLAYDKSGILLALEDLATEPQRNRAEQETDLVTPSLTAPASMNDTNKVLIVDGMALVNAVQKKLKPP